MENIDEVVLLRDHVVIPIADQKKEFADYLSKKYKLRDKQIFTQ